MDITAYDSDISETYSKFFDAYSQAKRRCVFPKDLASFIDSFLVEPKDFNIHTCHPFNTSDDRYFFDYEEDEDHIYIWLNVSLNFSRGDIFMDEKSNTSVVSADNQESTPKTNENGDTSESVSELPEPIAEVATAPLKLKCTSTLPINPLSKSANA